MKVLIKNVKIKAVVTCLPEKTFEMDSLKGEYEEKEIDNVKKTTGVVRVHVAGQNQTTSDLCFEAAELLIKNEKIVRDIIDGVVFVSQTFDYLYPATSVVLQHKLGLSQETICFDISYGCSGYLYGLFQAASMIHSGACKNVLLMAGDTNTKILNPSNLGARMVFGDCGSATLISEGNSSIGFHLCSNGAGANTVINVNGGFRHWPDNVGKLDYSKNANKGDDVFAFIVSCGTKSIKTMLEFMEWDKDEVDFYALHQATKFTLDFMKKKMKLDQEKAPFNIKNYGNTGPTTVPLVLTDYANGITKPDTRQWHKVVLAAYGVGLSWGSAACDLSETNIYKPINQDLR